MKNILYILLIFSWQRSVCSDLTIRFKHFFNNKEIQLNSTGQQEDASFTRIKYYISNIEIKFKSGEVFNNNKHYLIDLEKDIEGFKLVNVPEGTIEKIQFGIGVDSLTNANGIMDGDLDPMNGMYWAWNSGYINFKIEGILNNTEEFQYHIGGFLHPFQSYQITTLSPQYFSSKKEININVDFYKLFKGIDFLVNKKIMSPSKRSVEFSKKLPQIFSIAE